MKRILRSYWIHRRTYINLFLSRGKHLLLNVKRKHLLRALPIVVIILGIAIYSALPKKPHPSSAQFRQPFLTNQFVASDKRTNMTTSLEAKKNELIMEVKRGEAKTSFSMALSQASADQTGKTKVAYTLPSGTTMQYETIPEGIKEEIVLQKPLGRSTITTTLSVDNVEPYMTSEGQIVFLDAKGNYQFHIRQPFAVDANGTVTHSIKYRLINYADTYQTIKKNINQGTSYSQQLFGPLNTKPDALALTNTYTMVLELDPLWFADPNRAYPVTIDPTVVHDTSAEFATGQLNRVRDIGSGASPILESSYQQLAADKKTIGLWHVDETANDSCTGAADACDSSGNGNHGTATGTTINTTTQKIGAAARSFAGAGNSISIPTTGIDTAAGANTTVEFWMNWDGTVGVMPFGWNTLYDLYISSASCFGFNSGNGEVIGTTITIPTNQWVHVAAVFYNGVPSANNVKLYINGIEQSLGYCLGTTSVSRTVTTTALISGWGNDANNKFTGSIDDLRISNGMRAQNEIYASASRRPSSSYTSGVIDLSTIVSWNSLSWSENGVTTADGETLKDATNLIAQWNFNNNTNTTTATNDAGSCGASCNGTLTNFSTGSSAQDALAISGWTTNNRRWGAGALMVDGTDDYVTIPDNAALTPTTITVESWVNPRTIGHQSSIVNKQGSGTDRSYVLHTEADNLPRFSISTNGTASTTSIGLTRLQAGKWYHLVGTYDGANVKIYVNGILEKTTALTGSMYDSTGALQIGWIPGWATAYIFNGVIDSTRIYSRALAAPEILSNYNSGNIELQTRVGTSTDSNDGTWEAWRPVTNEVAVAGMNEAYQYDTAESNLIGYWPMDEATNGTCTGSKDACDVTSTNHGTQTNGSAIVDGVFGRARSFDGTDDYIDAGDSNSFDFGSGNFAIEAWVKRNVVGQTQMIVAKDDSTAGTRQFFLAYISNNVLRISYNTSGDAQVYLDTTITVSDTNWHHIVGQRNGSTFEIYKDGKLAGTGTTGGTHAAMQATATTVRFGQRPYVGNNNYMNGVIDEVRMYNTALSAATVMAKYLTGSTNPALMRPSTSTTIKTEGSAAQKIQSGQLPLDTATVGLWHMDETGGTSAYIKDSTVNANHGTPTGTTVVNGVTSKARSFNGSSDLITVGTGSSLNQTSTITVEAWIKLNTYGGAWASIFNKRPVANNTGYTFELYNNTGGLQSQAPGGNCGVVISGAIVPLKTWAHVAATYSVTANTAAIYVNGVLQGTGTCTSLVSSSSTAIIGTNIVSGASIDGSLDEVRVSNTARSAEEIAESYRMGRDHYMSKTISSTDLSGKQSLPFSIAADRPGTYLEATVGETPYSNYQADTNTVGLWHLDEQSSTPTSCYSLLNSGVTTSGYYTIDPDGSGANAPVMVYCDMTTDGGGWTRIAKFGTAYNIVAASYSTGFGAAYSAEYAHPCALFNAFGTNITTRVNMGSVKDYFRPTSSYTLCQMITETPSTHFTWSSNNGTFQTPSYYSTHFGGSAASWPTAIDGRSYLSFWGLGGAANSGCCHNTSTIYGGAADGAAWNRAFDMYFRETTPSPSQLLKDASGNGNDGALSGASVIQGQKGLSRNFDGSNDYINLGSGTTLDFGNNGAFTYAGWVRPTTLVDYAGFVSKVIPERSGVYSHMTTFMANGRLSAYTGAAWVDVCPAGSVANGVWTHVTFSYNGTTLYGYINGQLCGSAAFTYTDNAAYNYFIGSWYAVATTYDYNGIIDEVSISKIVRTATEIRQLYETGIRTHPITIDFGATLDSGNLITGSGDTGFTVDATYYGLSQKGSNLYLGDSIIVRENYDGTEYIAQGIVNSVNASTGAITVSAWDAGGTFPSGGYTANASVFKWQREYWNITEPLDDHLNITTLITLRLTNGNEGRIIWLDDLRSNTDYLTTPGGSTITSSTGNRYFQYRTIFHSFDESVSPQLTSVTLDYVENSPPSAPSALYTEGATNPVGVVDTTPEFSAINTDVDAGDIANKYEIQVDDNSDFSSVIWDSGGSGTSMTNCITGNRCADVSYAGSALTRGTTYYWRIRFWDDDDATGAWSAETATFILNVAPTAPVLNTPADTAITQPLSPTLRTTGSDTNTDYLQYKIELCTNVGMSANCQTFDQTSNQTGWSNTNTQSNTAYTSGSQASYTLQTPLTISTTYYWRSYSIDPAGSNTWSSTQGAPFSFTTTDGSQKFNMNGLQLNGININ